MKRLLMELHALQDKYGFLPKKRLEKLSKKTNIPLAIIYGTATFYSSFELEKQPKYVIGVVTCPSCIANGALELIKYIEKTLNIEINNSNGKYLLLKIQCMGRCYDAPIITINKKIYTKMNIEKLSGLLKKCR